MKKDNTTKNQSVDTSSDTRRQTIKRSVAFAGVGLIVQQLPSHYTRPVVNAVLMPAHAQMSLRDGGTGVDVPTPMFSLSRLFADLRIPSGEVIAVNALSRVRVSGCNVPPGETVSMVCTAVIDAFNSIVAIETTAVATAGGNIGLSGDVNATVLIPIEVISSLRIEVSWGDVSESFTVNAAEISAAIAGPVAGPVCS